MTTPEFRGVIAPNLTPFNDDLSIATDLYIDHAKRLLDGACAAIAPFGTTGEALSVGIDERIEALTALVDGGVDAARMIPGTGLTNLADTVRLSQACLDLGCAGIMVLPPFYYKNVSDDGLYAYFRELIARIDRTPCPIYLYHIPQVAGVGLTVDLVRRLKRDFPGQIAGIKDSAGDLDNTLALLGIDDLIVYPGSELPILDTAAAGSPGCISATANLNGDGIAQVLGHLERGEADQAAERYETVRRTRLAFQAFAPIPAQKALLAEQTGDGRWATVRPPLEALAADKLGDLHAALDAA